MVHRSIGFSAAALPPFHPPRKMGMMMHMTFYWGKYAEVLIDRWPGKDEHMYDVSLAAVFVAALVVEMLTYCKCLNPGGSNRAAAALLRTVVFTLRIGVSYLLMLAVMCFNVGIFLAAVAGHGAGFLLFGSWRSGKSSDLPRCHG